MSKIMIFRAFKMRKK